MPGTMPMMTAPRELTLPSPARPSSATQTSGSAGLMSCKTIVPGSVTGAIVVGGASRVAFSKSVTRSFCGAGALPRRTARRTIVSGGLQPAPSSSARSSP